MSVQTGAPQPVQTPPKQKLPFPGKGRQAVKSGVLWLLAVGALVFFMQSYVLYPVRVSGSSMENTLRSGDALLASPLPYALEEKQRGDIVICRYPDRTEGQLSLSSSLGITRHTLFVKRLVALPGDVLEITGGRLYINGQLTADPPAMGSTPRDLSRRTLGENEYFVMGDNRFSSRDSRSQDVGTLSEDAIVGKVLGVIWPLPRLQFVP